VEQAATLRDVVNKMSERLSRMSAYFDARQLTLTVTPAG
jgi:hypothetical protein